MNQPAQRPPGPENVLGAYASLQAMNLGLSTDDLSTIVAIVCRELDDRSMGDGALLEMLAGLIGDPELGPAAVYARIQDINMQLLYRVAMAAYSAGRNTGAQNE